MKAWRRVEPTVTAKVGWRTLTIKTFEYAKGKVADFTAYEKDGIEYAHIIAITKDNQVVIARQFRIGPEQIFDELPGGVVDPGEDPQTAVIRELQEETAYTVGKVTYLGKTYKDGFHNGKWHYFLATDCVPSNIPTSHEKFEDIEVDLISVRQLIRNALEGHMSDSQAVLLAYETLQRMALASK